MRHTKRQLPLIIVLAMALLPAGAARPASPGPCQTLATFAKVFPESKRIGVIYSDPGFEGRMDEIEKCGADLKLSITRMHVPGVKQLPAALEGVKGKVDVLWAPDGAIFSLDEVWNFFVMFAIRNKIITIVSEQRYLALAGVFYCNEEGEAIVNKRVATVLGVTASDKERPVKYYSP